MQIKSDPMNPQLTQLMQGPDGLGRTSGPQKSGTLTTEKPGAVQPKDKAFDEVLDKKIQTPAKPGDLKFSAHAMSRLHSRGIELSSDEIIKMQAAVQKANLKGSKESLILTDKAAFIVSVKNNTVITAVDKNSLKENVFTNIDSTIMI